MIISTMTFRNMSFELANSVSKNAQNSVKNIIMLSLKGEKRCHMAKITYMAGAYFYSLS